MNKTSIVVIISIIVIVGMGSYILNKRSNEIVEQSQNCSLESSTYFNRISSSKSGNLGSKKNYTNHFDQKEGKCFMVFESTWSSENVGGRNIEIYDVYDHKDIGGSISSYNTEDINLNSTYCYGSSIGTLSGSAACDSLRKFINEKMQNTNY